MIEKLLVEVKQLKITLLINILFVVIEVVYNAFIEQKYSNVFFFFLFLLGYLLPTSD